MAVLKPRNRILIFRLTEDEYSNLRAACSDKGARSLSEFARQRLMSALGQPGIDQQITELHSSVRRIEKLLERV
jgi:hypothetical protein